MVHEHSREAYREERDEGKLAKRCRLILDALRVGVQLTDRDVMTALGFTDMNAVRPRITELIDEGFLEECGEKRDSVTGKRVRIVRTRPMGAQGRLF